MASYSSSNSVVWCQNCNKNCGVVRTFPCLHEFCIQCTNNMTNGAEITCFFCSIKCHWSDIRIKNVERLPLYFREEDSVSTFSEISLHSEYDQDISDLKKNEIVLCEKHKQSLSIYCQTCAGKYCPTCSIEDHSDHTKSDNLEDNLEKNYSILKSDFNKYMSTMIKKNKLIASLLMHNSEKKIPGSIADIKDKKSKIEDIINNQNTLIGKNEKLESKWKVANNILIEDKTEKEINTIKYLLEKLSLEKMISSELLKSFKVDCGEVGTVLCQSCKCQFDQVCTLQCGHQTCEKCFYKNCYGKEIYCSTCGKYARKCTMEQLDEKNLSINIVLCPNCKRRYDEVHTLPCLHQFCKICKENMEEGEDIHCGLCYKTTNKDRVVINIKIEKGLEKTCKPIAHPSDDVLFFSEIFHYLLKEENNVYLRNEKMPVRPKESEDEEICNRKEKTSKRIKVKLKKRTDDDLNKKTPLRPMRPEDEGNANGKEKKNKQRDVPVEKMIEDDLYKTINCQRAEIKRKDEIISLFNQLNIKV